ncbi:MAG: hypothetical protein H6563_02125 [Lewinellaceae bacterium]|nr:hypothetical protein [Lewinellaceae bacterium]
MKAYFFFLFAGLLLAGCTSDMLAPADDSAGLEFRKKEYVTKPMTMWLEAITDYSLGSISCLPAGNVPAGGWMRGHATHMGQFNMEESPWAHGSCQLVFDPSGNLVKVLIEGSNGHWTAANGDVLNWQGTYESFLDGTFSADLNFAGGTGSFEGATGNVFGFGYVDPETGNAVGTAEGYITMLR